MAVGALILLISDADRIEGYLLLAAERTTGHVQQLFPRPAQISLQLDRRIDDRSRIEKRVERQAVDGLIAPWAMFLNRVGVTQPAAGKSLAYSGRSIAQPNVTVMATGFRKLDKATIFKRLNEFCITHCDSA